VTDILDKTNQQITKRLNELKPRVDEYHRLESAAKALDAPANAPRKHSR
jgi:hypothetical protein